MSTANDCFACCDSAHGGASRVGDLALKNCLCNSPGSCAAQCASELCAGWNPVLGDPCDQCASGNAACNRASDQACAADVNCKAFQACSTTAACASKP
jgi:hypothetical protein